MFAILTLEALCVEWIYEALGRKGGYGAAQARIDCYCALERLCVS